MAARKPDPDKELQVMKHTPLYERHMRDASAVINLKGFARAMHYRGHIAEHKATRESVTLCDVSHMGEIDFQGPDALALVQKLITNDAAKLAVNQVLYSALCNAEGNIIDDLVCYRLAPDRFVLVVNVTKIEEDYQWVLRHAHGMDVQVKNVSADTALMALQGPNSREVLQRITRADLSTLRYYWLVQTEICTRHGEIPCMISRTGYTGECGYEIMVSRDLAPWIWDELLLVGQPLGIMEHGVAARESLRTEAGYLLNGNDMDAGTNPYEAGIGWVVRLDTNFIGRDALVRIKAQGVSRKMVGLEVEGPLTMRHGCPIFHGGVEVGKVTSGPLSAQIAGRNLGLGYISAGHAAVGTDIEIEIRGKTFKARVVAMPFCERKAKQEPSIRTWSPYDLRFTEQHVWARAEGDLVTVGLSDFGQRELGDILSLDLPQVGTAVTKGTEAAWGDSYRRPFELSSPVTGEIVAVNAGLLEKPRHINAYPFATQGILKLRTKTRDDYDGLLGFERYAQLTRRLQQYDQWSKGRRMT
jgi:aminomethyltransferase